MSLFSFITDINGFLKIPTYPPFIKKIFATLPPFILTSPSAPTPSLIRHLTVSMQNQYREFDYFKK